MVAAAALAVSVPGSATVASSVEMHPAASVPEQHVTKSGPPTAAQEEQKAGVQAFDMSVRGWTVMHFGHLW